MGMNDIRYLACPECGTWTTRTAEWLAAHRQVPCYQCGTPIATGASERQPELEAALPGGGPEGVR
jgi:hypothetical protein